MDPSLQNVPVELLTEIMKLACNGSMRSIFSLFHVNQAMRRVAFSTPDLWKDLAIIFSVFQSIDGPLIPKSNFDFISFWCDRFEASTAFTLYFGIHHIAVGDLIKAGKGVELVCLDVPRLWKIIRLLTRARYLRNESTTLEFLRSRVEELQESLPFNDGSKQTTFPVLENLAVDGAYTEQDGRGGYEDDMHSLLALFGIPQPIISHKAFSLLSMECGTRVEATFCATPTDWRAFFGGLTSLEMARIKMTIVDPDEVPEVLPRIRRRNGGEWLAAGEVGGGTLRVELYWRHEDQSMMRMLEDLKGYLGLPEVSDMGGRGKVKISLKDYADGFSEDEDMWFTMFQKSFKWHH